MASVLHGIFGSSQENICLHLSAFLFRVDCSYAREHPEIGGAAARWVGPSIGPVYYGRGSSDAQPSHVHRSGDARVAPTLTAAISIDDRGTVDPLDDQISGTFTVGPAARSTVSRAGPKIGIHQAVELWDRIVHTLAAAAVSQAAANSAGGYDYVIASKGFPSRLCQRTDPHDCFPAAAAPEVADGSWGAYSWATPGSTPIGRADSLGGNRGATTTATFEGYACVDDSAGFDCRISPLLWKDSDGARLDNVLLKISTGKDGHIVALAAYWTKEFFLPVGSPNMQPPTGEMNSWTGGYFELTADDAVRTPRP